jgi:hypothetical protein
MIFQIFSQKKLAKKLAFFAQNEAELFKNWIITLVFVKKTRQFIRRKLTKIAENRDHNIRPIRSHWRKSSLQMLSTSRANIVSYKSRSKQKKAL